jgi:hypothetical protein
MFVEELMLELTEYPDEAEIFLKDSYGIEYTLKRVHSFCDDIDTPKLVFSIFPVDNNNG